MAKSKKIVKKKTPTKTRGKDNFIHMRGMYPAMTVVLKSPLQSDLESLAKAYFSKTIEKNVDVYWALEAGASFLHPKDQYHKAEGRRWAKNNLKTFKLKVNGVRLTKTHIFVDLEPVKFEVPSKDKAGGVLHSASFAISLRMSKKSKYSVATFTYPRSMYEEQSAIEQFRRDSEEVNRLMEERAMKRLKK